jgi:RNA polymerase sigma-70 factor (sigma-E family)
MQVGAPPGVVETECDAFVRVRLPQLVKFARALTGDDHAAADLVQDALEQLIPRWSRLSGDPEAYLRRVMVNRRVSVWRKVRRERLTDRLPEYAVSRPGHDDELFAALRQLPQGQRAVIALRYLEDLTEVETARVLGCSVGTVKSQTSRAMARLRTLLEEDPS